MTDPIQIVLLLDIASDTPITLDAIKQHLPDKREERITLKLSDFGVPPTPRGAPADWAGCAEAVARMIAAARARVPADGASAHYYVAGRAALPVFAHVGLELSKWAEITVLNRRGDGTWDVFPLRDATGAKFFTHQRGLDATEPSEADGRVAIFVSTAREAPREAIHAFMTQQGERTAGIVEVRAGGEMPAVLDAASAPAAAAELTEIFARIPRAYPRLSGLAVFIDGPAPLAVMVGRAINTNYLHSIWVPNFVDRVYHPTVTLPWRGSAPPAIGASAEDELARVKLLHAIVDEIIKLKSRIQTEHLPPLLADDDEKRQFLKRLQSIEVARDPAGDAFDLSVAARRLTFGRGLLEGLRRAPEPMRVGIGLSVFLHELFHFDQGLHSTTYRGIGRAGFVLEEVDYWADVFAAYTLAKLEISRRGDDGREHARDIVLSVLDAGLVGIEAFDRFEQGDQIGRLYERRVRRYLICHLQRARAEALVSEDQLWTLFGQRLVVELSMLQCQIDERGDKLVVGSRPETELMAALGGRLLRMPRSAYFEPASLVQAVRTFHRTALEQAMRSVRDQHGTVLVPWVK